MAQDNTADDGFTPMEVYIGENEAEDPAIEEDEYEPKKGTT